MCVCQADIISRTKLRKCYPTTKLLALYIYIYLSKVGDRSRG